jgi:hypothetical protein
MTNKVKKPTPGRKTTTTHASSGEESCLLTSACLPLTSRTSDAVSQASSPPAGTPPSNVNLAADSASVIPTSVSSGGQPAELPGPALTPLVRNAAHEAAAEQKGECSPYEFAGIVDRYIAKLDPKKQGKALLTQSRIAQIHHMLTNPKDTKCGTALDRHWARNTFKLVSVAGQGEMVFHKRENKACAAKEVMYDIITGLHQGHHGRDATWKAVSQRNV